MIDSLACRLAFVVAGVCLVDFASAQDVPGIEICTVEKQIDRRTSCLQSNVDFLHRSLQRQQRDANDKLTAAGREIAAAKADASVAKADIAALKDAVSKLRGEIDDLKKPKAEAVPAKK